MNYPNIPLDDCTLTKLHALILKECNEDYSDKKAAGMIRPELKKQEDALKEVMIDVQTLLFDPQYNGANNIGDPRVKLAVVEDIPRPTQATMLKLLNKLKDNPTLFVSAFLAAEKRDLNDLNLFTRVVISSIFSNCCSTKDEARFLRFIEALVDSMKCQGLFVRDGYQSPRYFNEFIRSYIKCTTAGEYLVDNLREILVSHLNGLTDEFQPSSLATRIMDRVMSNVNKIPYGIRYIAGRLQEVGVSLQWDQEDINSVLLHDLLFGDVIIPCMLRPTLYGNIWTGIEPTELMITQMAGAATRLLNVDMRRSPQLNLFFKKLVHGIHRQVVLETKEGFDMDEFDHVLITKGNYQLLTRSLGQNSGSMTGQISMQRVGTPPKASATMEQRRNYTAFSNSGSNTLLSLVAESELACMNEKFKSTSENALMILRKQPHKRTGSRPPIPSTQLETHSIRETKKKLTHVLLRLPDLFGVTDDMPIVEALELQLMFWQESKHSMSVQVEATIKDLRSSNLPDEYKENNYQLLLYEIISSVQERRRVSLGVSLQGIMERTHYYVQKLTSLRNTLAHAFLNANKLRQHFYGYHQSFASILTTDQLTKREKCDCDPLSTDEKEAVKGNCRVKSKRIRNWVKEIVDSVFPGKNRRNFIDIAIKQLEANFVGELSPYLLQSHPSDNVLSLEIRLQQGLPPSYFHIPEILWFDSPWVPAQKELLKMQNFKAPRDKFRCIENCWELVDMSTRMLDEASPDNILSVMSYVIYAAAVPGIISTIHFIELYCSLDEQELNRLYNFKACLSVIQSVLKASRRTSTEFQRSLSISQ